MHKVPCPADRQMFLKIHMFLVYFNQIIRNKHGKSLVFLFSKTKYCLCNIWQALLSVRTLYPIHPCICPQDKAHR